MKKDRPHVGAGKPTGLSEKVTRLLEIYTLIAQGKYPSVGSLMESFKVSERTVFRYLEQINMVDAIEYDRDRNGYRFVHGDRIKKLRLEDEELITLLAAGKALSHLGPAFRMSFQNLLEKLFSLPGRRGDTAEVPIIVKMSEACMSEATQRYLMTISLCMKERRSVSMVYRALGAAEPTERLVDPYGLVFYDGVWILVGYCHLRRELRSFALDRVVNLSERFLYFKTHSDFNLEEYLADSWGVVRGEPVQVTVRFGKGAAEYIVRKQSWHPSERRKVLPSGEVDLTFTVAGVIEIKRWIYSWLPNVEVKEPLWLRQQIREELTQSIQRHQ